jgi:hypothetical protein
MVKYIAGKQTLEKFLMMKTFEENKQLENVLTADGVCFHFLRQKSLKAKNTKMSIVTRCMTCRSLTSIVKFF